MRRLLASLLLLGALVGLFEAQFAYASGLGMMEPVAAEASGAMADSTMAGMDCAEMMAPAKPQPQHNGPKPCKGMTLACIAQMGCTTPVLLGDAPVAATLSPVMPVAYLLVPGLPLAGRSYAPEPEPPTVLG